MGDGQEGEQTGAAFLDFTLGNRRDALNLCADLQRLLEIDFAAGEHPSGQGKFRQEVAGAGMPVFLEHAGRRGRGEQDDVPAVGQRCTILQAVAGLIERRGESAGERRGYFVMGDFLFAEGGFERVFEFVLHFS